MDHLFTQITGLLILTVVVALAARFLRQPIIVAYIFAGIAGGPIFLNIIDKSNEEFEIFSKLGVILLLFIVGLSLNFGYIKKIGKVALFGGFGQALFTAVFGYGILRWMSFDTLPALYLAIAITFSSTIIITKLLSDKKQTDSLFGRHTIGLLLVQDVIAVILMVFLTANSGSSDITDSIVKLAVNGFAFITGLTLVTRFVLPRFLNKIADSTEFLFLFSVAWCFVAAFLSEAAGFSYEVGAVAAGIALASSPYQPEINARITPLKDFFLIIFFIILGAELDLSSAMSSLAPSSILALFILIGNPLILYLIYRRLKFSKKNSLFIGLTAAQVSEFGFVLLYIAREMGHVGQAEISIFTIVAITTIFASSYLITNNEFIYKLAKPLLSLFGKDYDQPEEKVPEYETWVIGYHRIGWNVVKSLKFKGTSFAVIDVDPAVIASLKKQNIPAYFIDAGDVTFLSELPLRKAKTIISTIPGIESQLAMIRYVRAHSSEPIIIANSPEAKYTESLYEAGADYVMTPHLLGGKWLASLIADDQTSREDLVKLKEDQNTEVSMGLPIHNL